MKKIYLLDTNIYLTDSSCIDIFSREGNDILIPLKVLDEVDKHKKRQDLVGIQARNTIRRLDKLRESGNLFEGVRPSDESGKVYVKSYDPFLLPDDLDLDDSDNKIIATALTVKEKIKAEDNTCLIVVSRDINMRVKCDSLGIESIDHNFEQVVDDVINRVFCSELIERLLCLGFPWCKLFVDWIRNDCCCQF